MGTKHSKRQVYKTYSLSLLDTHMHTKNKKIKQAENLRIISNIVYNSKHLKNPCSHLLHSSSHQQNQELKRKDFILWFRSSNHSELRLLLL